MPCLSTSLGASGASGAMGGRRRARATVPEGGTGEGTKRGSEIQKTQMVTWAKRSSTYDFCIFLLMYAVSRPPLGLGILLLGELDCFCLVSRSFVSRGKNMWLGVGKVSANFLISYRLYKSFFQGGCGY